MSVLDVAVRAGVLAAAIVAARRSGSHSPESSRSEKVDPAALAPTTAGRGRNAESPGEIPASGWKDISARVRREVKDDNLTTVAAGMTYYGFLALIPALGAIVSVYGLISDPADVRRQIGELAAVLPASAAELIGSQLESIATSSDAGLGFGFAVSLAAALWSVSSGVSALIKSINLAYDEPETRHFVKLRALALALSVGMVVFVVFVVFVVAVLPRMLDGFGLSSAAESGIGWLRWPGLAVVIMLGLAVFYRYAPNRDPAKWRWVTWGAGIATVIWLLASGALSIYVNNFGSYNETYGALGGVVVLLLWMYVSALIVLVGAEVDAEIEAQTLVDSTVGPAEPVGERGAVKADRLGTASV